jgi:amidase
MESFPGNALSLEELTIPELQERMQAGGLTSEGAAAWYLERIRRIDRHGPALNAVIEVNPDALSIARSLDDERARGIVRGPMHGIPILIKDNLDTADRMQTTAGSLALEGEPAPRDAFIVERLREAGAVILGKTNLSEWANFRSTRSSSGWSSRGGQTRNPYALDRSPCGSSSGSAVAVSANLCAASVGTETDGSIICPSHANGIVGIKPTLGLVSRSGVIPIAHSQDTAGPMGRTVVDAAIMLGVMQGFDRADPAMQASQARKAAEYSTGLDPHGLDGTRIGVARDYFGFDERVDHIMEKAISVMKQSGADLIDIKLPAENRFGSSEVRVLFHEFKEDLEAYLAARGGGIVPRSLRDIVDFNEANRDQVMPFFGQERMLRALKRRTYRQVGYRKALEKARRTTREEGIDSAFEAHRLGAIVAPAGGPAWLIDLVNGDHHSGGGCTSPAAVAGYPSICVPAGFVYGLPIGIVFVSQAWQEPSLIRIAYAFEQKSRARRQPEYLPSVDLSRPAWE